MGRPLIPLLTEIIDLMPNDFEPWITKRKHMEAVVKGIQAELDQKVEVTLTFKADECDGFYFKGIGRVQLRGGVDPQNAVLERFNKKTLDKWISWCKNAQASSLP